MKKYNIGLVAIALFLATVSACNKGDAVTVDFLAVAINSNPVPAVTTIVLTVSDTVYNVAVGVSDEKYLKKDILMELTLTDGSINYNGKNANQHNFSRRFTELTDSLRFTIKTGVKSNPNVLFTLNAQTGNSKTKITQSLHFKSTGETLSTKDSSVFTQAKMLLNLDSIHSVINPLLSFTLITDTSLKGLDVKLTPSVGTFDNPSGIYNIDSKGLIKGELRLSNSSPFITQAKIKAELGNYSIDSTVNIYSEARVVKALNPTLTVTPNSIIAGDSTSIATIQVTSNSSFLYGKTVSFKASLGKFLFSDTDTYTTNFDNNGVAKAFFYQNDTLKTGKAVLLVDVYNGLKLDAFVDIVK